MAKDNKTAGKTATENTVATVETTTVENIYEKLDKGIKAKEDFGKEVLAKIEEERNERTKYEMKSRYLRAQYDIESGLLELRRQREIAKVTKDKLTMKDRLSRFLMGFDVTEDVIKHIASCKDDVFEKEEINEKDKTVTLVTLDDSKKTYKVGEHADAIIDYVDYDRLIEKIKANVNKKMSDIEDNHTLYYNKLRAAYGEYWNSRWNW